MKIEKAGYENVLALTADPERYLISENCSKKEQSRREWYMWMDYWDEVKNTFIKENRILH